MNDEPQRIDDAPVALQRDPYLRLLLRELVGSLEEVVGLDEASGYISVVGAAMGEHLDREYRRALQVENLERADVARVLVNLKRRIQGGFYIVSESDECIVLGNRACPFGEMVKGRKSLCMITSNMLGYIAAQNLGYAAVELKETIAQGAPGCTVVIHLRPKENDSTPATREYYRREPAQD